MDWEFNENGVLVRPISVGFVCEDGRELYLINAEQDLSLFAEDNERGEFLRAEVLPFLPIMKGRLDPYVWDTAHPDYEKHVFSRAAMRAQILTFMQASKGMPELWANYAVYDMICLNQLWGSMRDKDPILPWYCNDLQQMLRSYVINPASLPQQHPGTLHNALGDARHLRDCHDWAADIILHRTNTTRERE
jgi:hypothetical protein